MISLVLWVTALTAGVFGAYVVMAVLALYKTRGLDNWMRLAIAVPLNVIMGIDFIYAVRIYAILPDWLLISLLAAKVALALAFGAKLLSRATLRRRDAELNAFLTTYLHESVQAHVEGGDYTHVAKVLIL